MMDNYFSELNAVNVSDKIEKKNGLSYLSWSYAWGELKKRHPAANAAVYENAQGWDYHTDGRTCWVKVGVTVDGLEHIEYLPVMDYRNAAIPAEKVTSTDVNKAIQRAMTKAIARHGLGLYIYAGEDLPEDERPTTGEQTVVCAGCGGSIQPARKRDGEWWPVEQIAAYSERRFGRVLCPDCQKAALRAEKAGT